MMSPAEFVDKMEELCVENYDEFKRIRAYSPQERLKLRMQLAERGEELTPNELDVLLDDIIGRIQDRVVI